MSLLLDAPASASLASGRALGIRRRYSSEITNSEQTTPSTKTQEQQQQQEQKLLSRWEMLEQARRLLPENNGLAGCGRYLIPIGEQEGVNLLHLPKTMGARLVNVQRCGSVWPCPVCGPKISQHRQTELRGAVDVWTAGGGALVMCSYTFRHSKEDTLPVLLGSSAKAAVMPPLADAGDAAPASGLLGARSVSMSGRAYSDLKRDCGMAGSVRCLEVTFGDNGPHPHIHELPFLVSDAAFCALVAEDEARYLAELIAEFARQKELTLARGRKARARRVEPALKYLGLEERHNKLVAGLEVLWHEGLAAVGLSASEEHGFHASPFGVAGNEVADYIAKFGHEPVRSPWDVSAELAMQPVKLAGRKGVTPMQLLADCTFGEGAAAVVAGERFASYARAMRGRRQLVWSNGLRELLGLGQELTDEEAADCAEDEDGVSMGVLSPVQWRLLASDRNQGRLVNAVKSGDAGRVAAFLAPYAEPSGSGRVTVNVRPRLADQGADERDKLLPVGLYVDPLTQDPDALAMWPGLTTEQAKQHREMHHWHKLGDPFADRVPQLEYIHSRNAERAAGSGSSGALGSSGKPFPKRCVGGETSCFCLACSRWRSEQEAAQEQAAAQAEVSAAVVERAALPGGSEAEQVSLRCVPAALALPLFPTPAGQADELDEVETGPGADLACGGGGVPAPQGQGTAVMEGR